MTVRVNGTWREETGRVVYIDGQWRNVSGRAVYVGGQWRDTMATVPAFSASAPDEAYGSSVSYKPIQQTVTSNTVTITPNGGKSPYTYSWSRQSGDARIGVTSATMASTAFTASLREETATATFGWTVRDANNNSATGSVYVELTAGSSA